MYHSRGELLTSPRTSARLQRDSFELPQTAFNITKHPYKFAETQIQTVSSRVLELEISRNFHTTTDGANCCPAVFLGHSTGRHHGNIQSQPPCS